MIKNNKKDKLLKKEIYFGGVSLVDLALYAKHMSVMLKAGLSITDSLDAAKGASKGKLKKVLGKVLASVTAGQTLSDSYAKHPDVFSNLFINVTRVGERSGTLIENLETISNELEKEKYLVDKIRSAMVYPIIILVASVILGGVLSVFILPQITPLFEGLKTDLPFTTRTLIWFSDLMRTNGISIISFFLAFVVGVFWVTKQKFTKPITHWILLKIPLISGISRNVNLARFTRTFSLLLKSGIPIAEALDITSGAVNNFYYQEATKRLSKNILGGRSLSENLKMEKKLFPDVVIRMAEVGEKSGKLSETFSYISVFYDDAVDTATKRLSTAIEPILLLIIGGVVAFLALSIITPIYDITGNVGRG